MKHTELRQQKKNICPLDLNLIVALVHFLQIDYDYKLNEMITHKIPSVECYIVVYYLDVIHITQQRAHYTLKTLFCSLNNHRSFLQEQIVRQIG